MGSEKISFVTSDLREVATTASCARVWGSLISGKVQPSINKVWGNVKLKWMDKTFVPVFVAREKQTYRKRAKAKYVVSRNGSSILVKPIFGQKTAAGVWLKRDHVHPDDWELMMGSNLDEGCHSLRVPEWVAKKAGIL
jgi:hypothetical protein